MLLQKAISVIMGLAFFAVALALWVSPKPVQSTAVPIRTKPVKIGHVELMDFTRTIRASGITRATQRATLAFSVPGKVAKVPVEIGTRISKGAVIARLDGAQFQHAHQSAQAILSELKARTA